MSDTGVRSEAVVYGRHCVVCRHANLASIDQALVDQHPITHVAQQFGLSRDSVRRHLTWHLRPAMQRAVTSTPDTRPLALVERVARIANNARDASQAAYAAGNAHLGARLGDAELRALSALAERFGITHDRVAEDHADALRDVNAVARAMRSSRVVAEALADALDAEGFADYAADLRRQTQTYFSQNEEKNT